MRLSPRFVRFLWAFVISVAAHDAGNAVVANEPVNRQSATTNWPEVRGPAGDYQLTSSDDYPVVWSVAAGENIVWRQPLPETGQSGIAVWGDRLFLQCFRKLTPADNKAVGGKGGTWVSETIGYCLDAKTGRILWSCDLPGKRPNQVNGIFNDSTTPTPVTNGTHVWFVNAGGYMACHTLDGKRVWGREFEVRTKHSAKQFQPFLHAGKLYYTAMRDQDDPGRQPQTARDYDKNSKVGWPWMFIRCFDALTGEPAGILPGGVSVHTKGARGFLNGQPVLLHARGGSHSPPEKPYGLSLSKLNGDHDLVWERPNLNFEGTNVIDEHRAFCFDRTKLFVLNLATGKTLKEIPIRGVGTYCVYDEDTNRYIITQTPPRGAAKQLQTHRSNISVGNSLFFMSGRAGFLGRVNLLSGEVNYLQVPLQVEYENGKQKLLWKTFTANDDTGSGFQVTGDKRRLGHGFGHVSAATPIVLNNRIYFSTLLGTVYVIDATATNFDESALLSVNDLGVAGRTWTLSPFSAAGGRLYQRTSREVICIGTGTR